MPPNPEVEVDWSNGCVFVQDGHLYVSPNCKRDVHIPPMHYGNSSNPFAAKTNMKVADFKQPVWWNENDGWMSFIPLAPSYVPLPFNALSWLPRFDSRSWKGKSEYQMRIEDGMKWMDLENRIFEAVIRLRNAFKISSSLPPKPSENFRLDLPCESKELALSVAEGCRDWFAIWMGLLSYCIAQTKLTNMFSDHNVDAGPLWYYKLFSWNSSLWPQTWLDGIRNSGIVQRDASGARAGVVLDLSKQDRGRPPVTWFLEHGVPVFYPWRIDEERRLVHDRSLAALRPPTAMIEKALTDLFSSSTLPMSALVALNYYQPKDTAEIAAGKNYFRYREATDVVKSIIEKTLAAKLRELRELMEEPIDQLKTQLREVLAEQQRTVDARAKSAANLPTQGMVVDEEDWRARGRLVEDVGGFFDERNKRNAELLVSESQDQRRRRLQREKDPGVKKSDVYEWHKVETSGGKVLYVRVKAYKKWNAENIARCPKHFRLYDAHHDVWDLCEFLPSRLQPSVPSGTESDDDDDYDMGYDMQPVVETPLSPPPPQEENRVAATPPPPDTPVIRPRRRPSPHTPPGPPPRRDAPRTTPRRQPEPRTPPGPCPAPPTDVIMEDVAPAAGPSSVRLPQTRDEWEEEERRLQKSFPLGDSFGWDARDLVELLELAFGYRPPRNPGHSRLDDSAWNTLLTRLGYRSKEVAGAASVRSEARQDIERFYRGMTAKNDEEGIIPPELFDLGPTLKPDTLRRLNYRAVHRPTHDLFVFSDPRSMSVDWLLGVESVDVAMYCMRYLAAHETHTILNLASRLICRGVQCRTLIGVRVSPLQRDVKTIVKTFEPTGFRAREYSFTKDDFATWMNNVDELCSTTRFRAGLLKGGIIARICRAFMSLDTAIAGPSWEVKECRVGFIVPTSTPDHVYADDELTEDDMAKICGVYAIYNEERKRIAKRYWFPPHHVWSSQKCGHQWLEWTEVNEEWFKNLWNSYEQGKGQPKSAEQWASAIRGHTAARIFQSKSKEFAKRFCDENIPPKLTLPPQSLLERIAE